MTKQESLTKACMACERTNIAQGYARRSSLWSLASLPFIYLPVIFLPVVLISGLFVRTHLRLLGAQDLRTLRSFLPPRDSHRYSLKTQIIRRRGDRWYDRLSFWTRSRLFWVFNCTFYCPFSIGVLQWHSYLVMTVENWWCPFAHRMKADYGGSAIDASYWHVVGDADRLHPDDRSNPIWNSETAPVDPVTRTERT